MLALKYGLPVSFVEKQNKKCPQILRRKATDEPIILSNKGPVIINIGGGTEEKMVGSRKNIGGSRLG